MLVSTLIPCYNSERFIGEAIESVLQQDWSNLEVIVIDDGSEDNSVKVLESFAGWIRFEVQANLGACAARNRAFELSRGDFIQFLDSDDVIEANKFQEQISAMEADSADISLCKIMLFGDDKGVRPEKRPHPKPEGDPFLYFLGYGIQTASPIFRRRLVDESGGFLVGLPRGQEANFHLRVGALNPKVVMLEKYLLNVRMHSGDRISSKQLEHEDALRAGLDVCEFLDRRMLWNEARRFAMAKHLLGVSRNCFAGENVDLGHKGLNRVAELDPKVYRNDPTLRKVLCSIFGIAGAEKVIRLGRRFR